MPKKTPSESSPRKSKAPSKASEKEASGTRLGGSLVKGMEQILAHVRGEIELDSYYLPGPVDVRAIRQKTGLSQAQFAQTFALSPRTLQEWEQGKAQPDMAVRAYLTVIDRNPEAVVKALRS